MPSLVPLRTSSRGTPRLRHPDGFPPDDPGGDGRARLGRARRAHRHRRRLRRPPRVRPLPHRALPRGARLQGRRHRAARAGGRPRTSRAWARPRLFVGVSAGNLDSMLNKLTAQKKVRGEDQYSPGGRTERAPEPRHASSTANLCRQAFPGLPVVLGGIEASLRRIAHYDYWSDSVRRSILLDAQGGSPRLRDGRARRVGDRARASTRASTSTQLTRRPRHRAREEEPARVGADRRERRARYVTDGKLVVLPSYEEVTRRQEGVRADEPRSSSTRPTPHNGRPLLQPHGDQAVYFNPPAAAARRRRDGRALRSARSRARRTRATAASASPRSRRSSTPIVTMRGCFGGCTFCSITEHEGRIIQSRSEASVLREVRALSRMEGFRGDHHRRRRAHRQHVQDALQGRAHRERVPPALVRASRHLREPRHRSRAARRP